MKLGQEVKFTEDFTIKALISGDDLNVKAGDKAIVINRGYQILTGEARGKILAFEKGEETEGYDYQNIAKRIFNRINAVFGLEMYLDDEEIEYKEIIEEIEDVLMDIF